MEAEERGAVDRKPLVPKDAGRRIQRNRLKLQRAEDAASSARSQAQAALHACITQRADLCTLVREAMEGFADAVGSAATLIGPKDAQAGVMSGSACAARKGADVAVASANLDRTENLASHELAMVPRSPAAVRCPSRRGSLDGGVGDRNIMLWARAAWRLGACCDDEPGSAHQSAHPRVGRSPDRSAACCDAQSALYKVPASDLDHRRLRSREPSPSECSGRCSLSTYTQGAKAVPTGGRRMSWCSSSASTEASDSSPPPRPQHESVAVNSIQQSGAATEAASDSEPRQTSLEAEPSCARAAGTLCSSHSSKPWGTAELPPYV